MSAGGAIAFQGPAGNLTGERHTACCVDAVVLCSADSTYCNIWISSQSKGVICVAQSAGAGMLQVQIKSTDTGAKPANIAINVGAATTEVWVSR